MLQRASSLLSLVVSLSSTSVRGFIFTLFQLLYYILYIRYIPNILISYIEFQNQDGHIIMFICIGVILHLSILVYRRKLILQNCFCLVLESKVNILIVINSGSFINKIPWMDIFHIIETIYYAKKRPILVSIV